MLPKERQAGDDFFGRLIVSYDLDWLEANLEDMEALCEACALPKSMKIIKQALQMVQSERIALDESWSVESDEINPYFH